MDYAPRSVAWHMLSPFSKVRLSINSASSAFPHSMRRTRVYLLSFTRSPCHSTRLDQATNIAHYPGQCRSAWQQALASDLANVNDPLVYRPSAYTPQQFSALVAPWEQWLFSTQALTRTSGVSGKGVSVIV